MLMLVLVGVFLMSGSKGFILIFVQAYFFYSVFYMGKLPRINKKYIPIIIVSPLIVILLAGYASNFLDAISYWGYRLLANGDTYWNAYPYSVIDRVSVDNPILNITSVFWGPFRHLLGIDVNPKLFEPIGALLYEYNYGYYPYGGAPNSQLSIASYACYKWGGLIMTGIMAFVGGQFFRHGYRCAPQNIYFCCKRALLVMIGLNVFGDIYLFFSAMFNFLLFIGLYKSVSVFYPFFYSRVNNK